MRSKDLIYVSVVLSIFWIVVVIGGCDRLREDRAEVEARERAQEAIAAYSEASGEANGLHRGIVEAFGRANASTNLQDYRSALTSDVLPAMERFLLRLQGMPTGTQELKAIHLGLVQAYERAIGEIRIFVRDLRRPADLPKFNLIRERLQQGVSRYNQELQAHYLKYGRALRFQAGEETTSAPSAPSAATETTAPQAL